jgi:predicted O-methyltransferase YrrM
MQFRDTRFWQHYGEFACMVEHSSTRSTIDAVLYWRLLNAFEFKKFLEVGVFQGLTTGLFFESCPDAQVIGIDPVNRLELFYKYYSEYQHQLSFIEQPSQKVTFGQADNNTFDFILIDGDHSYESTQEEITKFLPMLKHTGVLAIDDYGMPGVAQAVKELYNQTNDWIPFLRSEQTEFWHHRSCNRSDFLDTLLVDPISNFILIDNQLDQHSNTVCVAKTVRFLTDHPMYFDIALRHYNI